VRRGRYVWTGGHFRKAGPVTVAPGRCDVCGGTGFLELAPLHEGAKKWACPVCRADYDRRHRAP
jgi:hypothetical protein